MGTWIKGDEGLMNQFTGQNEGPGFESRALREIRDLLADAEDHSTVKASISPRAIGYEQELDIGWEEAMNEPGAAVLHYGAVVDALN